jgi:hypothetical protein
MNKEMFRQGDLLIVRVDEIPNKDLLYKKKDGVLLEGETTGHAHRVKGGIALESFYEEYGMYVDVPLRGEVVHEEHGKIELEPGKYKIIRQTEYTPWGRNPVHD